MTPIVNAMSVDVEDYYHVSAFDRVVPKDEWTKLEGRVVANTERLLETFDQVHVKATGLDTMYRLQDVTVDSYWAVRDEQVANLDMAGMMLQAMGEGRTTLHATYGDLATITDVTVLK